MLKKTGLLCVVVVGILTGCSRGSQSGTDNGQINQQTNTIVMPTSEITLAPAQTPQIGLALSSPLPLSSTATENEKVLYYMKKLPDKNFTELYGDGQVWYTAAEELGKIGKPAIPNLIKNLGTKNDYERTLTLYALLLGTQHENVKVFTKGEYIQAALDFDIKSHPEFIRQAEQWWAKYKNNWDDTLK